VNLNQFAQSFPKQARAIDKAVKEARDGLVQEAFEAVVEYSPVLTGSYRARHQIAVGSSQGALIYEHPSKPPVEGIKTLGSVIPAPDVSGVEDLLAPIGPYERVVIFNDIAYAAAIEYGSGENQPKLVYEQTAVELQLEAPARFAQAIQKAIRGLK
jgi:hypothetical protein